jgi:hypothetical protein
MEGIQYGSYEYRNNRISDEMIAVFMKDGKSFIDVTISVCVSVYIRTDGFFTKPGVIRTIGDYHASVLLVYLRVQ